MRAEAWAQGRPDCSSYYWTRAKPVLMCNTYTQTRYKNTFKCLIVQRNPAQSTVSGLRQALPCFLNLYNKYLFISLFVCLFFQRPSLTWSNHSVLIFCLPPENTPECLYLLGQAQASAQKSSTYSDIADTLFILCCVSSLTQNVNTWNVSLLLVLRPLREMKAKPLSRVKESLSQWECALKQWPHAFHRVVKQPVLRGPEDFYPCRLYAQLQFAT